MPSPNLNQPKQQARTSLRQTLAQVSRAHRLEWSGAIVDRISEWDTYLRAHTILLYLATNDEPDLSPLIASALQSGKRICLPRMDWEAGTMDATLIDRPDFARETRRHAIAEPTPGPVVKPADLDLVVAPGLGFDTAGGRLGRGAGYYDRYLTRARAQNAAPADSPPTVIGVCFACQVLARIPLGAHDQRIDALVTEQSLVICQG